jgi:hypothetical protein
VSVDEETAPVEDAVVGVAVPDDVVRDEDLYDDAYEARRVRRAWYFIGVDAVLLALWMAFYLYERAANRGGNWLSVHGLDFTGMSPAKIRFVVLNHVPAYRLNLAPVSGDVNWSIAGAVGLSALIVLVGERRLHRKRARFSKFGPFAVASAVIATGAFWMVVLQLKNIPIILELRTNPPHFVHTGYGAAMVLLGVGIIVHLALMVAASLDLAVDAWSKKLSPHYLVTVRVTRMLWLWVGVAVLLTSILIHVLY